VLPRWCNGCDHCGAIFLFRRILPVAAACADQIDAGAQFHGIEIEGFQLRLQQGGLRLIISIELEAPLPTRRAPSIKSKKST
jgi:hypothetical protein